MKSLIGATAGGPAPVRLATLRAAQFLDRAGLAAKTGLSLSLLARLVEGQQLRLSPAAVASIAAAVGVRPQDLEEIAFGLAVPDR